MLESIKLKDKHYKKETNKSSNPILVNNLFSQILSTQSNLSV